MLDVGALSVSYGNIPALREVSLRIDAGKIVALIGSNGAGKSTLIKAIAGVVAARSGTVHFGGRDLLRSPAHHRAAAGVAVVPENRRLFKALSVLDNLLLGAWSRARFGRLRKADDDLARVFTLFPQLATRQRQLAGTMSGGEQQMLAIGRALMSRPTLILMDEPSIGLAPLIVKSIFDVIGTLRDQGCTVLLVEQNAAAALRIADDCYVLERGVVTLQGPAATLRKLDAVKNLYLGE